MGVFRNFLCRINAEDKLSEYLNKYDEKKLDDLVYFSRPKNESELCDVIQKDKEMRCKILASAAEVFEGLRAFLILNYGEVPVTRRNYMYELSNSIGAHRNPLACDTPYPDGLKDSCLLSDFLRAAGRETLIRAYMLLLDDKMAQNPLTAYNREWVEGNLRSILRICKILEGGGAAICGFDCKSAYGCQDSSVIDGKKDNSLKANLDNIIRHIKK